MTKFTKRKLQWGRFVDVKINAPEILQRDIFGLNKGTISLSTVTDPYQDPEKKYKITRRIMEYLAETDFSVSILTKSGLILRDIDILKKFKKNNLEVGFSITTLDDNLRRHFEPGAPSVNERINALRKLHNQGIKTWVFIAPLLPDLSGKTIPALLEEIKHSVDYLMVDRLNIKSGNWYGIEKVLRKYHPDLISKWRDILFSRENKRKYFQNLYRYIAGCCNETNIRFI